MGLSPKEREGLWHRPSNAHERATNDVRVRKKLAAWLNEFDDMTEIFLKLPPEQLRKELSDIHVHRFSFFLITAMKVLNFYPIIGEIGKPEDRKAIIDTNVSKLELRTLEKAHSTSKPVEDEDIWRILILSDLFDELNHFFGNSNPVVEADQLSRLAEEHPKFHTRLTADELRGIKRLDLAWENARIYPDPRSANLSDEEIKVELEKSSALMDEFERLKKSKIPKD
jgi:hypothetical protein